MNIVTIVQSGVIDAVELVDQLGIKPSELMGEIAKYKEYIEYDLADNSVKLTELGLNYVEKPDIIKKKDVAYSIIERMMRENKTRHEIAGVISNELGIKFHSGHIYIQNWRKENGYVKSKQV